VSCVARCVVHSALYVLCSVYVVLVVVWRADYVGFGDLWQLGVVGCVLCGVLCGDLHVVCRVLCILYYLCVSCDLHGFWDLWQLGVGFVFLCRVCHPVDCALWIVRSLFCISSLLCELCGLWD